MVPRVIRLRRPVVVSVHEGRFVPERGAASLDVIDARWEALRAANPANHDGAVYHVLGVHRNGHGGASVHVIESSYRFQAVQSDEFNVGHRGLGVRGIVRSGERVLLGKRSPNVGRYPGLWEFLPAGGLAVGEEPVACLLREMHEEIGVEPGGAPVAVALMFDDVARTWEIVFGITAREQDSRCDGAEHTAVQWFDVHALPIDLSPITGLMLRLLRD
jgi:8-oxo-dGTP diphosphatase